MLAIKASRGHQKWAGGTPSHGLEGRLTDEATVTHHPWVLVRTVGAEAHPGPHSVAGVQ